MEPPATGHSSAG